MCHCEEPAGRRSNLLKDCFASLAMTLCILAPLAAYADTTYTFSCPESSIKGAISYSIIGMYHSIFKECSGKIVYDRLLSQVKSVEISITTASLESDCKWCDNIVRSKHVLNAAAYPVITFKSNNFENKKGGCWVSGIFDLHGVAKNLRSPFDLEEQNDNTLFLTGTWELRGKDFNIIWSGWLDWGGFLVGDYITVDWHVIAHKT